MNLKEMLKKYKMWLNGKVDGERADLSGDDSSDVNLRDADISDVNLTCVNLKDVERMPELQEYEILGCSIPLIKLYPFEASAADKVVIKLNAVVDF